MLPTPDTQSTTTFLALLLWFFSQHHGRPHFLRPLDFHITHPCPSAKQLLTTLQFLRCDPSSYRPKDFTNAEVKENPEGIGFPHFLIRTSQALLHLDYECLAPGQWSMEMRTRKTVAFTHSNRISLEVVALAFSVRKHPRVISCPFLTQKLLNNQIFLM